MSYKDGHKKGQKWYRPNRSRRLRRGGKNTWKNHTKKDLHNADNHDGVITHLEPDIWNVKSSRTLEVSLQTKLVEVMEFQLSYVKS